VEAGRLRPDLEQVFLRQSRLPGVVQMDLRAAVSANTMTVRKIEALVDRYGADAVKSVMGRVLDAGEELVRHRLREIPDGTWSHRLYAEASHTGDPGLYRYQLTVRKRGEDLFVDNAGTDPQAGSINVTYAGLVGAFLSALTASLTPDLAGAYGGVYRRVHFDPVPGTLSCADFPAAVSPSGVFTMELLISLAGSVIAKMVAAGPPELRNQALGPAQPHWYGTIIAGHISNRPMVSPRWVTGAITRYSSWLRRTSTLCGRSACCCGPPSKGSTAATSSSNRRGPGTSPSGTCASRTRAPATHVNEQE
jgi:N-methylhydantoinase B